MKRLTHNLIHFGSLCLLGLFMLACDRGEELEFQETPEEAPLEAPYEAPEEAYPTTEMGVLQAFTQALESRHFRSLETIITAELGAELGRLHDLNPDEFWRRGKLWVDMAETGISLATHADDAFRVARWRALVRFGNGEEETVEFALERGRLLLANP